MSVFTNLVFSLLTANSGRSLFEVAAAITAHPVVAKKIRKIKRNPHSISAASLKSSAPAEPEKLTKLEAELTKLREEIGLLMQAKLQLAQQQQQKPADAAIPAQTSAAPPAPAPRAAAGVPPPPPPPPARKGAKAAAAAASNPDSAAPAAAPAAPAPEVIKSKVKKPIAVSLHQVIASGQPVALRRVELNRSPGGTPIKGGSGSQLALDHSTYLTQALKRKFRHAINNSPPTTPAADTTPEPAARKRTVGEDAAEAPAAAAPAPALARSAKAPRTPAKSAIRELSRAAPAPAPAPAAEEESLISFEEAVHTPPPAPAAPKEQMLISFDDIATPSAPASQPQKQTVDDLFMAFAQPLPADKENDRAAENKPQSPSVEKRKMPVEDLASSGLKRAATSVRQV